MSPSSLVQEHLAFWRREPVERPLTSISRWSDRTVEDFDWGLSQGDGFLEPDMLRVDLLMPQYEKRFLAGGIYDGQLPWTAGPPRALPWVEAIVGCPIRYSLPQGGFVADALSPDWDALSDSRLLVANAWVDKLGEVIDALSALADGRFPVAVPLLRGPWDLVSALRGQTNTYLDVYNDPDALSEMAAACARIWIQVNEFVASRIPRWEGGYVGHGGLWAPEFAAMTQNDCSVGVSPSTYGELMLAADRPTIGRWEHSLFHLHSGGLQVLDHVLSLLHGQGLNVTIDPSGPSLEELVPVLRRVQEHGVPLHVLVFYREHVKLIERRLSPRGLAILCWPID